MLHMYALQLLIPMNIPIYLSSLLPIAVVYILYKRTIPRIDSLGLQWNGMLFGVQVLLLGCYLFIVPLLGYLLLAVVFVCIEVVRVQLASRLASLTQELEIFEQERAQFNETFRIVRSERHDFLKHVAAIHFMLDNEKHLEAKTYLDDLVDGYEETNLSIKGEHGAVAGILHQMYGRASALGISTFYDFDVPLSSLPLSDKHIVTLVGNLLSNSIDACQQWQEQHDAQAQITLQFYKRSGLYLLTCQNNSLPIPTDILDRLFVDYGKSTKSGDHQGLGTKKIDDIVIDYQGFLDFIYKDESFTVKIKFPAIV